MNYSYAPYNPTYSSLTESADWPQFEKEYCSNYTCCGISILDLHELVAHFEEAHVFPPALSPSTSQSASPQSAPSPTCDSPSTPPMPNLFPTLTSAFTPPLSAFPAPSATSSPSTTFSPVSDLGAPYVQEDSHAFDSIIRMPDHEWSAAPRYHREASPPRCIPPSEFSLAPKKSSNRGHPARPTVVVPKLEDTQSLVSSAPSSPLSSSKAIPKPKHAKVPALAASQTGRKKAHHRALDSRDKPHKCPKPGCIKTYLNPNGLKYHVQKGTCDFGTSPTPLN